MSHDDGPDMWQGLCLVKGKGGATYLGSGKATYVGARAGGGFSYTARGSKTKAGKVPSLGNGKSWGTPHEAAYEVASHNAGFGHSPRGVWTRLKQTRTEQGQESG